jgi:hypothetical protein
LTEYFVRIKGRDLEGKERTLDLKSFSEADKDPERELGIAKEIGWARTCHVSPLPDSGVLFRKEGDDWKEVARVF